MEWKSLKLKSVVLPHKVTCEGKQKKIQVISSLCLRYVSLCILQQVLYHKFLFFQFYSVIFFIIIILFTRHQMQGLFQKQYGTQCFDHWVAVNAQELSSDAVQGAEDALVAVLRLILLDMSLYFFPCLSH